MQNLHCISFVTSYNQLVSVNSFLQKAWFATLRSAANKLTVKETLPGSDVTKDTYEELARVNRQGMSSDRNTSGAVSLAEAKE